MTSTSAYPVKEMYSFHPRDELDAFWQAAPAHHVKPEIECFYTGAFSNPEFIRARGLLDDPIWAPLSIGWPGGTWTPLTQAPLLYLTQHLPWTTNWNLSVIGPSDAVEAFCHGRVGWETALICPTVPMPKTNAELVDIVVRMAHCIGRPVASPDEAHCRRRRVAVVRSGPPSRAARRSVAST